MHGSPDPQAQHVSYLKVIIFSSILVGIILICMVFGGYSSFVRAENRIAATKTALLESCRERLALLPPLATLLRQQTPQDTAPATTIEQAVAESTVLLQEVEQLQSPLDRQKIKDFEVSQTALTMRIQESFTGLRQTAEEDNREEIESLRQKLLKAQDNLYIANERYKEEVSYFNLRLKSFPVSYIAKLFGFDKTIYYPPSELAYLPARKAFTP